MTTLDVAKKFAESIDYGTVKHDIVRYACTIDGLEYFVIHASCLPKYSGQPRVIAVNPKDLNFVRIEDFIFKRRICNESFKRNGPLR